MTDILKMQKGASSLPAVFDQFYFGSLHFDALRSLMWQVAELPDCSNAVMPTKFDGCRITIPARFRSALGDKIFAMPGLTGGLWLFAENQFASIVKTINAKVRQNDPRLSLKRYVQETSYRLRVDDSSRVYFTKEALQIAGIFKKSDRIKIRNCGNYFQVTSVSPQDFRRVIEGSFSGRVEKDGRISLPPAFKPAFGKEAVAFAAGEPNEILLYPKESLRKARLPDDLQLDDGTEVTLDQCCRFNLPKLGEALNREVFKVVKFLGAGDHIRIILSDFENPSPVNQSFEGRSTLPKFTFGEFSMLYERGSRFSVPIEVSRELGDGRLCITISESGCIRMVPEKNFKAWGKKAQTDFTSTPWRYITLDGDARLTLHNNFLDERWRKHQGPVIVTPFDDSLEIWIGDDLQKYRKQLAAKLEAD